MRSLIIAIILLTFLCVPVYADGMVIERSASDLTYSRLAKEDRQVAVIAYEDGIETLILGVDVLSESSGFVWFFPIPAKPQVTDIDIVKVLPELKGKNVIAEAKETAEKSANYFIGSQLYPILFMLDWTRAHWESRAKSTLSSYGTVPLNPSDVIVHKAVTKFGTTTELITADTLEPLLTYLRDKGLELPAEASVILDDYIGKDFSFVVSWVEDKNPAKHRGYPNNTVKTNTSVTISFPTDRIFFPLKPTSVYGKQRIPIELTIQGYVDLDLPDELDQYHKTSYFFSKDSSRVLIQKLKGTEELLFKRMTWVRIYTKSNLLKSDLYIEPKSMFSVAFAESLFRYGIAYFIIIFAIISFFCGEIAGLIVFRKSRASKDILTYGLIGLANFATVLGVLLASGIYTDKTGYGRRHVFAFTGIFTVLFMILTLLVWYRIIWAYTV